MNHFLKRAGELIPSLCEDRRYLHQHAEAGNDLPVTTQYVMRRLLQMGLEPREICKSGMPVGAAIHAQCAFEWLKNH